MGCPYVDGAYKLSADYAWVHVSCSLYHPNVEFSDAQYSEYPILRNIPKPLLDAKCNLCEQTYGAKIKCTQSKECNAYFHTTCAQRHGLYLFLDPDSSTNALTALCKEHTLTFKQNASKTKPKLSGKKRKRSDDDFKPKAQKLKRSTRRKSKAKPKPKTNSKRN